MNIKAAAPPQRLSFPVAAILTVLVALIQLRPTTVAANPLQLIIESERTSPGCYRLRVVKPGDPVLVFLDGDIPEIRVSAGQNTWNVGARSVYGLRPWGTAFQL